MPHTFTHFEKTHDQYNKTYFEPLADWFNASQGAC